MATPYMWMEGSLPAFETSGNAPRLMVVMGVAGCGKSTIADGIARALKGTYLDGDSFHPPENIAKMSAGTPLTDADRWPWLTTFSEEIAKREGPVVGACSALKRSYREHITNRAGEPVCFIYLDGSKDLIAARMNARAGHFMPPSLLDSQFAALEIPGANENAISVDISGTADDIVALAMSQLHNKG